MLRIDRNPTDAQNSSDIDHSSTRKNDAFATWRERVNSVQNMCKLQKQTPSLTPENDGSSTCDSERIHGPKARKTSTCTFRVKSVPPSKNKCISEIAGECNTVSPLNTVPNNSMQMSESEVRNTVSISGIKEKKNINNLCRTDNDQMRTMMQYEQRRHQAVRNINETTSGNNTLVNRTKCENIEIDNQRELSDYTNEFKTSALCTSNRYQYDVANKETHEKKTADKSHLKIHKDKQSIVRMFETIAAEEVIKKKKSEYCRKKSSALFYKELDDLVEQKKKKTDIGDPESRNSVSEDLSSYSKDEENVVSNIVQQISTANNEQQADDTQSVPKDESRFTSGKQVNNIQPSLLRSVPEKTNNSNNLMYKSQALSNDQHSRQSESCNMGSNREILNSNVSERKTFIENPKLGKNEAMTNEARITKDAGLKCANASSKENANVDQCPLDCVKNSASSGKSFIHNADRLRKVTSKQTPLRSSKCRRRFSEQKKCLVNMFEKIAVEEATQVQKGQFQRKISSTKVQCKTDERIVGVTNNEEEDMQQYSSHLWHKSAQSLLLHSKEKTAIDERSPRTLNRLNDKFERGKDLRPKTNTHTQVEENRSHSSNPELNGPTFLNLETNTFPVREIEIGTLSMPDCKSNILEDVKKVGKMLKSEADTYLALEKDMSRINAEFTTVKSHIRHLSSEVQKKASLRNRLSVSLPDMTIDNFSTSDSNKVSDTNSSLQHLNGRQNMKKTEEYEGNTLHRKFSVYDDIIPVQVDDGFHSSSGSETEQVIHHSSFSDCLMIVQDHHENHNVHSSSGVRESADRKESGELFRFSQSAFELVDPNQDAETAHDVSSSSDTESDKDQVAIRRCKSIKDMTRSDQNVLSQHNSGVQREDARGIIKLSLIKEMSKNRSWVTKWMKSESVSETRENNIVCLQDLQMQQMGSEDEKMGDVSDDDDNNEADGKNSSDRKNQHRGKFITVNQQLEVYEELKSEGLDIVADRETRDIISDTISACNGKSIHISVSFKNKLMDEPTMDLTDESDSHTGHADGDKREKDIKRRISLDTGSTKKKNIEKGRRASVDSSLIKKMWRMKGAGGGVAMEETSTSFSTMFGYFNFCFYNFIAKEYGMKEWKKIITGMKLSKKEVQLFETPQHDKFNDCLTNELLHYTSTMLNQDFNSFLQKYGTSYFDFCSSKYGDLLRSIATNLADFINNMDDVRRRIHKIEKIPDPCPPSIHASVGREGNLLIYYYSHHDQICLDHFLIGYLKSAAFHLYDMQCNACVKQKRNVTREFSVISMEAVSSLSRQPSIPIQEMSNVCVDLILRPHVLDDIFPFHIFCDQNLLMTQIGVSLNQIVEKYIPLHGLNIKNYFKLVKPAVEFSYKTILNNVNTAFILENCDGMFTDTYADGLILKGQMTHLPSSSSLWFIASPKVDRLSELNELSLSSIPLHDATREVLLISEQSHATDTLKSQLRVLTNRLRETSKELALGKISTEALLDEIFPKEVAHQLMLNQPVPAVSAEEVSILFTDIVDFTRICGECDPEEITTMLNNLYLEFDVLCEKYDSYKVETIGDAYMAVCGIHRKDKEHGRNITLMGIEMVERASQVSTPKRESLQIRVGIHTGSVVAGVVGTRMPRYCLFGNNTTLANKMESTSQPKRVHISPATYIEIKHHQEFVFWYRHREVMPIAMQKLYEGNTFFVTQRCRTMFDNTPATEMDGRTKYPYMKYPNHDKESKEMMIGTGGCCSCHTTETDCSQCDGATNKFTTYERKCSNAGLSSAAVRLNEELKKLDILNEFEIGNSGFSYNTDSTK